MLENLFDQIKKIFNSEHPLNLIIDNICQFISNIWNYKVFVTADKHSILISNIVIGIILFLIGLKFARRASNIIKQKFSKTLDLSTANLLERISYYFLIILIAIFVLDISNVPLTVFAVVGTTFALGIGLGSQNIANNFISGLIIMIEQPVKLGDIIEIGGKIGEVTDIGARCVSIQTSDNINMLIPNSNVLQDVIINWTHKDTTLRSSMNFKIASELEIAELDKLLISITSKHPHILKTPPVKILYKSISKDYYDIEVEFWMDLSTNIKSSHIANDINRALADTLRKYNSSELEILKEHLVKL